MQASQFGVSTRRAAARGFTMVELMAVVAIVGILATIATISYRKYVARSKIAEVLGMFILIKTAQEAYRDETFRYVGPSGEGPAGDLDKYYPNNPLPGKQRMNFAGAGNGADDWKRLGVQSAGPVLFVYACTAGTSTQAVTQPGSGISIGNWPATASEPWYVVKARANIYGSGGDTVFVTSSFNDALFAAND